MGATVRRSRRVSRACIAASLLATLVFACAPLPPGLLAQRQRAALARGDHAEAVRLGRIRVDSRPEDVGARYDFACALARAGDEPAALDALEQAIARGYDDAGWMLHDDDLATLRGRPRFTALVTEATRIAREGIAVPGAKTLVRDDVAMPVRLRLPATERPKLALWLHPHGARLNPDIERLAPVLFEHGYALAVPMHPPLDGWTDRDLYTLLEQTLPRLADVVDVEHPLLIGLSAGGQAALVAWTVAPERFSGVLAMAPPAELFGHALPERGAPVLLLIGEHDPAVGAWRNAQPTWQSGARRVTFVEVPGKAHEFLLDDARLRDALGRLGL